MSKTGLVKKALHLAAASLLFLPAAGAVEVEPFTIPSAL